MKELAQCCSTLTESSASFVESTSDGATSNLEPPQKKLCSSLFGYRPRSSGPANSNLSSPEVQLDKYLSFINQDDFDLDDNRTPYLDKDFTSIRPLISRIFCIPATSAAVECVFTRWYNNEAPSSQN